MILSLAILLFSACLGILAMEDYAKFEIKLEVLPVLAFVTFVVAGELDQSYWDLIAGALIWGGASVFFWYVRPSEFGQGDIWLFASAGLVIGLDQILSATVLLAAASVATAFWYSHVRGKRPFKSLYPAAIPVSATLFVVLEMRLFEQAFAGGVFNSAFGPQLALPFAGVVVGSAAWIFWEAQK